MLCLISSAALAADDPGVEVAAYYFPNWGPIETSEWGLIKWGKPQFEGRKRDNRLELLPPLLQRARHDHRHRVMHIASRVQSSQPWRYRPLSRDANRSTGSRPAGRRSTSR
jgi:hypothetical protein